MAVRSSSRGSNRQQSPQAAPRVPTHMNILYSDASVERLIQNDTLRYELSEKHVIDEYFELSRTSYNIIKKKIKV